MSTANQLDSPDNHRDKAAFNEQAFSLLQGTAFHDWSTTMLFYAALHLTSSVLADVPEHRRPRVRTHADHKKLLRKHPILRSIHDDFAILLHRSWTARYICLPTDPEELEDSVEMFERIKHLVDKYYTNRR